MRSRSGLARLLRIHAVILSLASVVLVVAPALIPGVVGVHLRRDSYLLAYLLAAAELSLAVLSWLGSKLTDHLALRALIASCVTFHAATAVLEIYAFMQGTSIAIWANVAARVAIIGLLLYYRPSADR